MLRTDVNKRMICTIKIINGVAGKIIRDYAYLDNILEHKLDVM